MPQEALGQDETGKISLPSYRAQYENLQGPGALYNEKWDCISSWDSETARVYWTFEIEKPGSFHLITSYSGKDHTEVTVSFNGETKSIKIPASGGNPKRFKQIELGRFIVDKAGKYEVSLMPIANKWNSINLKETELQRVE